jgi:hypothetical protein
MCVRDKRKKNLIFKNHKFKGWGGGRGKIVNHKQLGGECERGVDEKREDLDKNTKVYFLKKFL